jgi:hypothetical protein
VGFSQQTVANPAGGSHFFAQPFKTNICMVTSILYGSGDDMLHLV